MGAMVSATQIERVERYVEIGRKEGAVLATGGRRRERPGHFFEPTVFASVTNDMTVAREEIFGPVVCVIAYHDVEEALEMANDSEYGLVAGVFGNDLAQTTWLADRLDAGQIFVNDWFVPAAEAPFGGFKQSGFRTREGPGRGRVLLPVEERRHHPTVTSDPESDGHHRGDDSSWRVRVHRGVTGRNPDLTLARSMGHRRPSPAEPRSGDRQDAGWSIWAPASARWSRGHSRAVVTSSLVVSTRPT